MHPQLQEIEKVSEGLYYISETDAPFHVVEAENTDPKQAAIRLSGGNEPMEEVTLEHFFRNAVKIYPDATPEQK